MGKTTLRHLFARTSNLADAPAPPESTADPYSVREIDMGEEVRMQEWVVEVDIGSAGNTVPKEVGLLREVFHSVGTVQYRKSCTSRIMHYHVIFTGNGKELPSIIIPNPLVRKLLCLHDGIPVCVCVVSQAVGDTL